MRQKNEMCYLAVNFSWKHTLVIQMQDDSNLRELPSKTCLPRENVFIQIY